jgi:hypothetical protein
MSLQAGDLQPQQAATQSTYSSSISSPPIALPSPRSHCECSREPMPDAKNYLTHLVSERHRRQMQDSIMQHIRQNPSSRDFNYLAPPERRRIPPHWNDTPPPVYYSYSDFVEETGREPSDARAQTPLHSNQGQGNLLGLPGWADWTSHAAVNCILEKMFEIRIFWHGPLDVHRIAKLLPGILQHSLTSQSMTQRNERIKAILDLNQTLYGRVIKKFIKPITM